MISKVLSGWNFMRLVRLALGIVILIKGIMSKDWEFAVVGSLFTIMPLLNIGCCGASGCAVPVSRKHKESQEVNYEEVR